MRAQRAPFTEAAMVVKTRQSRSPDLAQIPGRVFWLCRAAACVLVLAASTTRAADDAPLSVEMQMTPLRPGCSMAMAVM
jgi:hypothetical protein